MPGSLKRAGETGGSKGGSALAGPSSSPWTSLPWSLASSVGVHAAIVGGLAWVALSAPPRRAANGTTIFAASAAAAIESTPEPDAEALPELELDVPPDPLLVEADLPLQPLLVDAAGAPPSLEPDSGSAIARLLRVPWSSGAAQAASGDGPASEALDSSAGATAPAAQANVAGTTPAFVHAERLDTPEPVYPRLSQRLAEQGTVELRLFVRVDGTVADASIVRTSGFERLDQAALEAVKRWRFRPATSDGVAVDSDFLHLVTFRLEGE